MKNAEILAPAGGKEQLIAAVRSGADAVYLGYGEFNARAHAQNFTIDDLADAVKYAHQHNVKVHLTFNTLIKENELEDAKQTLIKISRCGIDAIIVQDLGIAKLIHQMLPELPMHASTQMTVHNVAGCKMCEKLGFSRVVLSRELSLNEIKKICQSTTLEVEVFIHGALCMCFSGGCYLSSVLGQRSGNRGQCAQPCRLDFNLNGFDHALSLKDMSHIDYIRALHDAGVCSFKIEGRMKRPEYVACAVASCKKALFNEKYDKQTLQSVFSRSGFTDGYITGKRNDMFGFRQKSDVLSSESVLKKLSSLYNEEIHCRKVDFFFRAKQNENVSLTAICDGACASAEGDPVQPAQNRGTTDADITKQLSKLGDTPYYLGNIEFDTDSDIFLPLSAINALRREVLCKLTDILTQSSQIALKPFEIKKAVFKQIGNDIRIRALKKEQILPGIICSLPPKEIDFNCSENIYVEIPSIIYPDDEEQMIAELKRVKSLGVSKAVCNNIGAVYLSQQANLIPVGGWGLNVMNSLALEVLDELGVSETTASFETSSKNYEAFKGKSNCGIIGYGFLPLMRMRACPNKRNSCKNCNGINTLVDRMNIKFTIMCNDKKYCTMLNSLPLYIGDKEFACDFSWLYFNLETPDEIRKIYNSYLFEKPLDRDTTGGLYFKNLR